MLKIFLAEDEVIVRETIKRMIPWEELGFELVGEAADGEMALPLLIRQKPDLLITDIKMPFMDGLTLAKLAKKELPELKIVILSGYDDFNYAKQAISIGVEDYLLKPITKNALIERLSEIRSRYEHEKTQKEYYEKFQREMQAYEKNSSRDFFEALVCGSMDMMEVYKKAEKLGLDIVAEAYNILIFTMNSEEDFSGQKEGYSEWEAESLEMMEGFFSGNPLAMLFRSNIFSYGVLLKGQKENIEKITKECVKKIKGILILSSNDYATFKVWCGDIEVAVQGDFVQEALNQPIDKERVIKQMKKTGNTEFEFEELDVQIQGNVFLPMQSLNELRREGLELLQKKITEAYWRAEPVLEEKGKCETVDGKDRKKCVFTASAQTLEQLQILIAEPMIQRIYADCSAFPKLWKVSEEQKTVYEELIRKAHENQKEIYFIMPYIFREHTRVQYEAAYESIFNAPWDGVLIRNYESFGFLKKHGYDKTIRTDYNMYQFNSEAKAFWKEQDVDTFTAPLELTAKEMKRLGVSNGDVLVYGHLPMMVSAGCVQKTLGHCKNVSGMMTITDRYRKDFVVKNECDYCYNVIYNQVPLYLGDKMQEVYDIHPESCRLMFTTEDDAEMRKVLQNFEQKKPMEEGTFTRGHWKNGIK